MEWVYKCRENWEGTQSGAKKKKKTRQTALHASIKLIPLLSSYIEKSRYTSGQWLDMHIYISRFSVQFDFQPHTQPLDTQRFSFIMNNFIQTSPFGQNRYSWRSHFDNPYKHQVQGLCHLGLMSCRVQVFGIRVCKSGSTIKCLRFALCNRSLLSLSALCTHNTHINSKLHYFLYVHFFTYSFPSL